jgi:hypothetical protein
LFTRPHSDEEDKVGTGGAEVEEAAAFEVAERGFDPGFLDPPEAGEGAPFEEDAAGTGIGEEEEWEEPSETRQGVEIAGPGQRSSEDWNPGIGEEKEWEELDKADRVVGLDQCPGQGRHPGMGAAAVDPREAVDERGGKAVHRERRLSSWSRASMRERVARYSGRSRSFTRRW